MSAMRAEPAVAIPRARDLLRDTAGEDGSAPRASFSDLKRHYLADALEASRALCHARDMPKNRDYTLAQDIARRQRSPNPHDSRRR